MIATVSLPQFLKGNVSSMSLNTHCAFSRTLALHIQQHILEITENFYDEILEALKQWSSHQSPENNATLAKTY